MKKNNNSKKIKKVVLSLLIVMLSAAVIYVVSFFVFAKLDEIECIEAQILRMQELEIAYDTGEAEKVDEQSFCSFDLDDADQYSFNDLQLIASHNSYKLYQPTLSYWFANTFYSLAGYDGDIMQYENKTTTQQLNMGIRSLEWDIQSYSGEFDGYIVQHESYIDPLSSIPNLELAFEEVLMWSEYNEEHIPIVIIIECKDSTVPDFGKENITTAEQIYELSLMISEVLGDKLYTPSDMLGDYDTLEDMRLADDYPSLDEMLGKIVVILHCGDYCENYSAVIDFEDQLLFTALENETSCFTIYNYPDLEAEEIEYFISEGYMIRTRISEWLIQSSKIEQIGIDSGSNILSSDYLYEDMFDEVTRFADGYTISLRDIG